MEPKDPFDLDLPCFSCIYHNFESTTEDDGTVIYSIVCKKKLWTCRTAILYSKIRQRLVYSDKKVFVITNKHTVNCKDYIKEQDELTKFF